MSFTKGKDAWYYFQQYGLSNEPDFIITLIQQAPSYLEGLKRAIIAKPSMASSLGFKDYDSALTNLEKELRNLR